MKAETLRYYLPPELIAQQPAQVRDSSALLVLDRSAGGLSDSRFDRLGDWLRAGDCLVLNDTKVLPARFFARRRTGARLEGLFLHETSPGLWDVMIKGTRKLKTGDTIILKGKDKSDFCEAQIVEMRQGGHCILKIDAAETLEAVLDGIGFPPLPPYIKRGDDPATARVDRLRYQTVYARRAGAVAAPTAGLHFTDKLVKQLTQAGICFARITLHVGAGTFKPIETEDIEDHRIHPERFDIDAENAELINTTRDKGGRIIAVGTTTTRALETAAVSSRLGATGGTTDLFITPGYEFRIVDAMVTNFHLPRSTLLALVAAFAGLDNILAAYRHAIEKRYRFYSYGDAMLIV